MRWNRANRTPRSDPTEIHVWRIPLDAGADLDRVVAALSDEEVRRADRFRFPLHRRRWMTARAALRTILAAYLGESPGGLAFDHGPGGKPFLAAPDGAPDLRFNLAHSGDLALCAVALQREVGVDVERLRRDAPLVELARRWFSAGEVEALLALPSDRRSAAFFACWTRKEAVVKAEGATVPAALKRFAVPLDPLAGETIARGPERAWTLATLDVGPGYAAALAYEGPAEMRRFRWTA
ncbi:MAG: 4'-phosphopantetheinyl transferase superfamily protein [Gemmatimonadetes bacterium]|nr:4'-phosphopantetheinyl transferase superfamily protein [Gemmatimonadota bacterium]